MSSTSTQSSSVNAGAVAGPSSVTFDVSIINFYSCLTFYKAVYISYTNRAIV